MAEPTGAASPYAEPGQGLTRVQARTGDVLTPLSFLDRSAAAFAERVAVIEGDRAFTYREFADRCRRLAGGLAGRGVAPGDRVAVLAPNTSALLECHYGVPLSGAVLLALNTRLTGSELADIVDHAGARTVLVDHDLIGRGAELVSRLAPSIDLIEIGGPDDGYADLLTAEPVTTKPIDDEYGLISLNYTSGTTGRPKGVMYHHRGAYLQALAMAHHARLDIGSVYLWTLPMFHCNGWCFTWAVTAAGGTHVCLRRLEPSRVWDIIDTDRVTHLNAAPTVLVDLLEDPAAPSARIDRSLRIATGGAPPSPTLLAGLEAKGIEVTHLYGLTETFGPAVVCDWWPEWDSLDQAYRARLKARQGIGNVATASLRVVDEKGVDVAADGVTMGEVAVRGNNVTLGYYRDPDATSLAIPDGWFRTGDLGVMHPDGYLELRDRAKDVIISGGENIASIEVEQALLSHPAVLEVAVVSAPDERWGEVPRAYVTVRPELPQPETSELIDHARSSIAGYKVPKQIFFQELPKTSTGKVRKDELRSRAWADPQGSAT